MNIICSHDGRYRYWKEVKLSDDYGACMFLMLNPASQDEDSGKRHPTLEKCKKFVRRWGYGTLWTCNLFALRSPFPTNLKESQDPIGPDNDLYILRYARWANKIVCAWGNVGAYLDRGNHVLEMLEDADLSHKLCDLGMTKKHQPKYPRTVPDDQEEFPLDIRMIARPNNESCMDGSNRLLRHAEELLESGDLDGASKNVWNAVEYYLKVSAESRGWPNRTMRNIGEIAYDLSEETDDPDEAHLLFGASVGSMFSMYEDRFVDYRRIEKSVKRARTLLSLLENRTKPRPESRPSQPSNGHVSGCPCAECRELRKNMLASVQARRRARYSAAS